jgi:hypothetical protein
MEIPEAVPKFLHYPHNHDFSLTFYKEKANQYPVYVTTLITGRTRASNVNTFDARVRRHASVLSI